MMRTEFTVVRTITLANGVRLEIAEKGPRGGTPIVMLHGITDSRHSFDPVWDHLPNDWHAIAVSQRGHGASDKRPERYSTPDFAADIALLAQVLDLPPMVVVGHSMGSSVALQLAGDRPDVVHAVVGIGTFARYRDKADLRAYLDTEVAALQDPVPDAVAREFQVSTLAHPIDEAMLEVMVRESRKVPARVWRAAFDGLLEDRFCTGIPTIQAPVLLLWGSATVMRCAATRTSCAPRCPTHAWWRTKRPATRCTGSNRSDSCAISRRSWRRSTRLASTPLRAPPPDGASDPQRSQPIMTIQDSLGHPVSGASARRSTTTSTPAHELRCFIGDPLAPVGRALAEAPDMTMAHVLRA